MEEDYTYIRVLSKEPNNQAKTSLKTLPTGIKEVIEFVKGSGSDIQSVLFLKDHYDVDDAKNWMGDHGYNIQEVYLVDEVLIDPASKDVTFIEERYDDEVPKIEKYESTLDKHDWMFKKKDIFFK